jgi:RNA polymerase sigma-70 factor, ECF subfamily
LRFFGGFSVEETAEALGIQWRPSGREQRMAEAWLHRELTGGGENG